MPLPSTMTPIATQTLASATATVTFSSIPQTYTDLVIIISAQNATGGDALGTRFNSDTATNYSNTRIIGNGSTASSTRDSNQTAINSGYTRNTSDSPNLISVNNYSNSTTYKTLLSRGGNAEAETKASVGLWRSTAAITSISFINLSGYNFTSGATFTLYGVKAA